MEIGAICNIVTGVSAVLLILLILLQQRGASLGAGFGASGELFTERRGLEKSMFNTTVVIAFIFVISILTTLMVAQLP